jgi:hypothetical protein
MFLGHPQTQLFTKKNYLPTLSMKEDDSLVTNKPFKIMS